nr:hypothetical protein [Tanacetum cinerariifolium]
MGDEHLDTILATELDEFIKSCVENLVPNPSDSEGENGCDVLAGFTTFSNVLFDDDYDSDSRIDETDCHPEKEIRLTKRLLYHNSSPRPPKEIVFDNSHADIESFSPSPIPNEDSDSHMEEIDLSFNPDDPMPPGIEEDDDEYKRDISILEELLDNYSLSLPANESYHFDISSLIVLLQNHQMEKSPDLFSYLGFEAFQPSSECPMMINGKNIPLLDVPLFHFYPLDQFKYGGN